MGRSLSLGFALTGLLQALNPVMAAGFLLIGAYNARQLAAAIAAPAQQPQYAFIWSRQK